jgi:mono/diheme cytochrome c family protein
MARTIIFKAVPLGIVALGFGYLQTAQPQQAPQPPSQPSQRALLDQYCVGCHNQRLKTADLMLDKADPANPTADTELWEKVIRKLRAGAMPPQGVPRPPAAAVDSFASYLETSLDQAAAAKPNPGRATLHRLNRAEYGNAVRDLLGLKVDVAALLPPDDESYGFDNNADVLGLSPALLEQYVTASSKIARLAVGDSDIGPVASTYRTRPDLSQDSRVEGLGLGTRGGLLVHHNFPLDGEYTFKVVLARNTVDVIRGLEEEHQLEITVDGERVQLVTIGGKEDSDALVKNPTDQRVVIETRMMARAQIKAGPRTVGATFLKKNSAENDYILQPFQRITLDPVNEVGLPHIENFIIAGPYKATGPGDTPSRRNIFACQPGAGKEDVTCAREILSTLARHAYRRPVTDNDLEPLLSFYQAGRNAGGSFDEGIERALRLILSDPQFIFRFERDPGTIAQGSVYRLSDLELASRLSFFLWSSIPDDELINVASQGKLKDPAVLEQQVRRMLADPRSESLVTNFAAQWLFLRNMKNTFPDPQEFPDFDDNLRQSLQKETELFVGSIFKEDHNVLDLLNANYTFVNERVARHYGIPNVYGSRFRKVTLTDDNRRGLLGQASILAVTSHTTRTSPVVRGKWILSNLLGTPPPPPPPDVPALKENSEGGKPRTVRERMQEHRANPTCASCHNIMDPLGFALENFDATGRWRSTDSGAPVDTAGKLIDGTAVNGPASLREALLSRPDVFVRTLTEKLMIYGLGRGLDYNDMPAVRSINREAAKNDYRFTSVILGIVKSTPFQMKTKADTEGKNSVY